MLTRSRVNAQWGPVDVASSLAATSPTSMSTCTLDDAEDAAAKRWEPDTTYVMFAWASDDQDEVTWHACTRDDPWCARAIAKARVLTTTLESPYLMAAECSKILWYGLERICYIGSDVVWH